MALSSTQDLLTRLQHEVRDESSIPATQNRLLSRLNEAQLEIVGGGGILNDTHSGRQKSLPFIFPWALSETNIVVNTEAPISSGTISVTKGSTSATLSATQASSLTGWFLKVTGDSEVYRLTHTAGTANLTLDGSYVNTTDASASFTIFKLDYEFQGSNILLPLTGLINYMWEAPIPIIDGRAFNGSHPVRKAVEGNPYRAGLLHEDAVNNTLTIRLNSYTKDVERLELPYVPRPAALDLVSVNPIVPEDFTDVLVQLAAYKELTSRDDDMGKAKLKIAQDQFNALRARANQYNQQLDPNSGRIIAFPGGMPALNGIYNSSRPNFEGVD